LLVLLKVSKSNLNTIKNLLGKEALICNKSRLGALHPENNIAKIEASRWYFKIKVLLVTGELHTFTIIFLQKKSISLVYQVINCGWLQRLA
jgi:hypothetical protein